MYCQNCGFKNPNGAIRCGRCGQALASPRQMQLNSQGSGGPSRAPRQQGSYPRPSSNARGYDRPSSGGREYDRRYPEKRRSSGAGKILLTILLVLILLAGAGFAVWYFVLRKPAAKTPQNPEIVVEDGTSQTVPGTGAQDTQNSQPQAAVETLPEGQGTASTVQEPVSSNQTADGEVQAFSSPVALFETDSYSMTANGYTAYGSNGYGLQVTFTNKTGSDVYFGFNQPALNDAVTNVQKAFRSTAGSSQTAILQLGNAAGGAASVKKISLPLVVYRADGNEYSIPSDMIENGNYELATTPVITLN